MWNKEKKFLFAARNILKHLENKDINKARRIVNEELNPLFTKLDLNKNGSEKFITVHEDILDLLRDFQEDLLFETKKDIQVAGKYI